MKKTALKGSLFTMIYLFSLSVIAQNSSNSQFGKITGLIVDEKKQVIPFANILVLKASDSTLLKGSATDLNGTFSTDKIPFNSYFISVSAIGYQKYFFSKITINPENTDVILNDISLKLSDKTLSTVTISAKKPFIEMQNGKMVLNVENSVVSTGSTVLEVLEKSPGVTIDSRNGSISLQGKTGTLIMIDGKLTYLTGTDLTDLLSSMNASQVNQIELITNPSAQFDASGNAGIINIKTKKNTLKGFNGSFTTVYSQGVYPKNTNSFLINFRSGKMNTYFSYNLNFIEYLTDIYASRNYYDANSTLQATLEQPTYFKGLLTNNTAKTGLDYSVSKKTSLGVGLVFSYIERHGNNNAISAWINPSGKVDSMIATSNQTNSFYKNVSVNFNAKHIITDAQNISMDVDWLQYGLGSEQNFSNQLLTSGGYKEKSQGYTPTSIQIISGKIDYNVELNKNSSFKAGWKSSYISTDNSALFQNFDGSKWTEDYAKSNQFIYNENINALYGNLDKKIKRLTLQAGLRYEFTAYNAHQLGNIIQKDSAFTRSYSGLFPNANISFQSDTFNCYSLNIGRRVDRPYFQTLNPFYFVINKYTYSTGNPYILPQYSWNIELSHQYKNIITSSLSYSVTTNFLSQLFLADTVKGVLLYSQGNVGKVYNLGASVTVTQSLFKWWTFTGQININHKEFIGFNGNNFSTEINQFNFNINNQFKISEKYSAELSGLYNSKGRIDIQEVFYPNGQLSFGVARQVLKNNGTLKLNVRDVFWTNTFEGFTQFPDATEYFIIRRDTKVISLSFTYRFGKAYKTTKASNGSARDEIERVGNG